MNERDELLARLEELIVACGEQVEKSNTPLKEQLSLLVLQEGLRRALEGLRARDSALAAAQERIAALTADKLALGDEVAGWRMDAAALGEQIAALTAALTKYRDDFCEGFCHDCPPGFTSPLMEIDCSGCRARAALSEPAPSEEAK